MCGFLAFLDLSMTRFNLGKEQLRCQVRYNFRCENSLSGGKIF